MTNDEKRRLAVQRELEELRKTVKSFDQVVADAQALAAEMRAGVSRLDSIDLDEKIDELDRLMGRGHYAPSTLERPDNVVSFGDFARDILCDMSRRFPS